MSPPTIGIIGDFKADKHTHIALNECITHCGPIIGDVQFPWIGTETLGSINKEDYDAFWIAPGSPYKDDQAVYDLIRWSRENDFPMLGICGGFQYMMVEYARNVLGLEDADHEESEPHGAKLVIAKMECSLKGSMEDIFITRYDSWLYRILKTEKYHAGYNCAYGINPEFESALDKPPLVFTAFSEDGRPRAFELTTHRFFRGTLFQPPLTSTAEHPNPLILDFVRTVASYR